MCGIAGFVETSSGNSNWAATHIHAMTDVLRRRGPDGMGVAHWPGVALGHRRLAIIDLSDAGHQPMLSQDRQVGVVFNGCVYNFLDLRQELTAAGRSFRSRCDTEVLVEGYQHWGIDGLVQRLRGMFAFAIWDERQRRLYMVRDRLGVKPLVYCNGPHGLAFGSTVATLEAAGPVGEMNPQAVLEYLEFGVITDLNSIYSQARKVPAATIVEWHNGKISERCYWKLPARAETAALSFEDVLEETERLLIESVRLRLTADVPIAALLSGGIDSALVCWALTKLGADVKAFTVSVPGDSGDETEAARQTAALLNIPHETVTIPADPADPVEQLAESFSEPFACQSALGILRLSEMIKPKATVLLTGDGGDDVFLGYPFYHNIWRAQRLARSVPGLSPALWKLLRPLLPPTASRARLRNFVDYAMGGMGPLARVRQGITYFEQANMLGERLKDQELSWRRGEPSLTSARHLLDEGFTYHHKTFFEGEFLPKVDGATMFHGLEARAPLLDQKLWEFAAALPAETHFHGGALKAVLRELARRRIGPDVANRKKRGFTIPVEKWLASRWSSCFDRLSSNTLLEKQGWIRPGSIQGPLKQSLDRGAVPVQLWYLVMLEVWLQKSSGTSADSRISAPNGQNGFTQF